MREAFPYPVPELSSDQTLAIKKLCEYIGKNGNGEAFEKLVREKESSNDVFSFLFPNKNESGNYYYEWTLFTTERKLSIEEIAEIEKEQIARLESAGCRNIRLTLGDSNNLRDLLQQNSGSSHRIKAIRKWYFVINHSIFS
jgi:hypothetical protein